MFQFVKKWENGFQVFGFEIFGVCWICVQDYSLDFLTGDSSVLWKYVGDDCGLKIKM